MRCVVTGAEGFLGANLCRALQLAGHEVTGTSLNRKGHTSLDALGVDCRVEYGDITDPAFVERVLSSAEAEWVFHLAAVSIVRVAQDSPARAHRTNILGTVNVLESARQSAGIKAVVVASSDKAYGDHGGVAYRESMPLLPLAPYETSKACADLIAQSYASTYGLPVMVTRCANLYGPGDLNWSRLVPGSCRQAARGLPPVIHGGAGSMRREYLHVSDAARACLLLAEMGQPGAYNVGSGDWATTQYVAETIAEVMGAPAPVTVEKGQPFAEIPMQALCTDKIRRLGWEPEVHISQGLVSTLNWYWTHLAAERPAVYV